MKILILGISGMLGKSVFLELSKHNLETYGTLRNLSHKIMRLFNKYSDKIYDNIDANNIDSIEDLILKNKPEILINCIGKIKQKKNLTKVEYSLINAKFPKDLNILSLKYGFKLIHFSTDCVFSGKTGNYQVTDIPDPIDDYGFSKYLGEVYDINSLTIRTSIIGFEIEDSVSLLEWVLSRKKGETIEGYKNAIWSGFTTIELSSILSKIVLSGRIKTLNGLIHLSSNPINKFDLINIIDDVFNLDLEIVCNEKVSINRSLSCFPQNLKEICQNKTHKEMIEDLLRSYEYKKLKEER